MIHGVAVLFACVGMMLFWRVTEESQNEKHALSRRLAEAEIGRRQFTSDLLLNLARRNQSMLYRQLDIINQLEESERDPDALAELFKLDHLATRVRRNAESLLVLSGEQPPRTWSEPVPLRDVLRAAIAETEDLERVVFIVDERSAVAGHSVTDLTHLIAELTENAVRFSPPDTVVTIRARPDRQDPGGVLLTVEDWGVGMPSDDLVTTNALLAKPPEIDLSVSQRLGFHVVARLAARHGIRVSLSATPGSGITALIALPSGLFASSPPTELGPGPVPVAPGRHEHRDRTVRVPAVRPATPAAGRAGAMETATLTRERVDMSRIPGQQSSTGGSEGPDRYWHGWWEPDADARASPTSTDPGPPTAQPGTVPSPRPRPASQPGAARPAASHPAPAPAFVPAHSRDDARSPVAAGGLRRRVPQASLAPELRDRGPEPGAPAVPQRTAEAANALSRYQASRQAARDVVEAGDGWRP